MTISIGDQQHSNGKVLVVRVAIIIDMDESILQLPLVVKLYNRVTASNLLTVILTGLFTCEFLIH